MRSCEEKLRSCGVELRGCEVARLRGCEVAKLRGCEVTKLRSFLLLCLEHLNEGWRMGEGGFSVATVGSTTVGPLRGRQPFSASNAWQLDFAGGSPPLGGRGASAGQPLSEALRLTPKLRSHPGHPLIPPNPGSDNAAMRPMANENNNCPGRFPECNSGQQPRIENPSYIMCIL